MLGEPIQPLCFCLTLWVQDNGQAFRHLLCAKSGRVFAIPGHPRKEMTSTWVHCIHLRLRMDQMSYTQQYLQWLADMDSLHIPCNHLFTNECLLLNSQDIQVFLCVHNSAWLNSQADHYIVAKIYPFQVVFWPFNHHELTSFSDSRFLWMERCERPQAFCLVAHRWPAHALWPHSSGRQAICTWATTNTRDGSLGRDLVGWLHGLVP